MRTLDEAWDLIERMNLEAYNAAYHLWEKSDVYEDEGESELAEDIRDEASTLQSEVFSEMYDDLSQDDCELISHWAENDEDFKEQFQTYLGLDS